MLDVLVGKYFSILHVNFCISLDSIDENLERSVADSAGGTV